MGLSAGDAVVLAMDAIAREAMLFAAVGFLIGGVDDLAIDMIWLLVQARRGFAPPPSITTLEPIPPGRLAIFVPAWRESGVIAAMARHATSVIDYPDYRLYIGAYPNDTATIEAATAAVRSDARMRLVINPREGPTTKADNLNAMWHALRRDDAADGVRTLAIIIHDAEDQVHPDELSLHAALLTRNAVVQVPVVPLIDPSSRWVSAHYADEFAESHGKDLVVRTALGAGLPLAGVGCAVRTDALETLARRNGVPFDSTSLVEDYEMGLRLGETGAAMCFATFTGRDGSLIATRAFFPFTLRASVVQKARWMTGIALAGWDRIGWGRWHDVVEHWMRMRDRRAPLAVLVLAVGWFALILWTICFLIHAVTALPARPIGQGLRVMLAINGALLCWRMAVRAVMTGRAYGWREGVRAIARLLLGNYIALLAVGRAFVRYVGVLRGGEQKWEKTEHVFPDAATRAGVVDTGSRTA